MSELFWKLNKYSDENAAASEKHVPVIEVKGDQTPGSVLEVTIDTGSEKHPNENGHHIQWVELLGNGLHIARAEFTPTISKSLATFKIIVPDRPVTLTAIARCNLHGLWESKEVKIG